MDGWRATAAPGIPESTASATPASAPTRTSSATVQLFVAFAASTDVDQVNFSSFTQYIRGTWQGHTPPTIGQLKVLWDAYQAWVDGRRESSSGNSGPPPCAHEIYPGTNPTFCDPRPFVSDADAMTYVTAKFGGHVGPIPTGGCATMNTGYATDLDGIPGPIMPNTMQPPTADDIHHVWVVITHKDPPIGTVNGPNGLPATYSNYFLVTWYGCNASW